MISFRSSYEYYIDTTSQGRLDNAVGEFMLLNLLRYKYTFINKFRAPEYAIMNRDRFHPYLLGGGWKLKIRDEKLSFYTNCLIIYLWEILTVIWFVLNILLSFILHFLVDYLLMLCNILFLVLIYNIDTQTIKLNIYLSMFYCLLKIKSVKLYVSISINHTNHQINIKLI